ncbi:MAG: hypothetical protein ACHQ06_00725 [Candidatus Dormibacteria bacterium]|jgi:hypothetical protein
MAGRDPTTSHPEDLPWNDVPADSDVVLGTEEPDPAEVEGDEGEEVDVSRPARLDADEYRRDTLDQRLAEEEPDRAAQQQEPEPGEFQAPESGSDDLALETGEADQAEPGEAGGEAAEDAAVHIRQRDLF